MSTSPETIQVTVLDDRRLMREGLESLLASVEGIVVVAPVDGVRGGRAVVVRGRTDAPAAPRTVHLRRASTFDELIAMIGQACAGAPERPGPVRRGAVAPTPPGGARRSLTPRERTVLDAVSRGRSAVEIAVDLGISPRTVERHKQAVMSKLGVRNQARAVALTLADASLRDAG